MSPRVVKFSGGRSSGMMLIGLLKAGELDPARGDVVLFNNTSAEHQSTYEFTHKIKELTEKEFNIPFFWLEFCTYENASVDMWRRNGAYRLVNSMPYDAARNPNGYHCKGEVFEEMVSHKAFLPSTLKRTCTHTLKIAPTNDFLADWWGGRESTPHLGHFDKETKITDDDIMRLHTKNGGETPREFFLGRKNFVRQRPHQRKPQKFADYTIADIRNADVAMAHAEHVFGGMAQLYGEDAMEYDSYLGLRKDEEVRFHRLKERIKATENHKAAAQKQQPPFEHANAPLVEMETTKDDVLRFWRDRPFGISYELDETGLFSNCVFCPLKGKNKLKEIARRTKEEPEDTPQSIEWWCGMEGRYQRDLRKERGESAIKNKKMRVVGFFGPAEESVYDRIKNDAHSQANGHDAVFDQQLENDIPCDCTD